MDIKKILKRMVVVGIKAESAVATSLATRYLGMNPNIVRRAMEIQDIQLHSWVQGKSATDVFFWGGLKEPDYAYYAAEFFDALAKQFQGLSWEVASTLMDLAAHERKIAERLVVFLMENPNPTNEQIISIWFDIDT